ncbi:hypothetical protein HK099_004939 [Clydaea vesicula]|uniref:Store-operated calcium entry-associated regulatory factor n=1 Tax=Clydaea vesicula TaxID=447962 RepID=A0AAD5U2A1_9FUNG|nr:hypothetical protein HK099_004939 [Clydaea vesicula]
MKFKNSNSNLLLFTAIILSEVCSQRVLLRDIQTLTFQHGRQTKGRRSVVNQMTCIGGDARNHVNIKTIQCKNAGFDGRDVQWNCEANLSDDFEFGNIMVNCEGYDYPDDPYVLAGSCGIEYEIYRSQNKKRNNYDQQGNNNYNQKKNQKSNKKNFYSQKHKSYFGGDSIFSNILGNTFSNIKDIWSFIENLLIFVVVAYLLKQLYSWFTSPSPLGPPPSYSESTHRTSSRTQQNYNSQNHSSSSNSFPKKVFSSFPSLGFFSGFGLGNLFGSSFFGRNRYSGRHYRPNSSYRSNSSWFGRDTHYDHPDSRSDSSDEDNHTYASTTNTRNSGAFPNQNNSDYTSSTSTPVKGFGTTTRR